MRYESPSKDLRDLPGLAAPGLYLYRAVSRGHALLFVKDSQRENLKE
jgi:hypothetical protein